MKVRVLMECSADFTIKSSHAISPWDLIQSQDNFANKMRDETDIAMNGMMKKELYKASITGDVQFLSRHDDIYLLSRSMEGNNILHTAISPKSTQPIEFIKKILQRIPILLCQTNANGDTPLHFAARARTSAAHELTISCKNTFQRVLDMGASFLYSTPPWRVRNSEGNTPLHEALRAGNSTCARFLIELDDEVASFVNNYKETPLHVYARYLQIPGPLWGNQISERPLPQFCNRNAERISTQLSELDLLLEANISAAFLRDMEGLTSPLHLEQLSVTIILKTP
ncbi:uncharacterized protein [Spinacia oleracea]|uniref:PGG domain-containing protein n=1 Tax=Spinacia oleracea TaxID=3562 RepID=A0A9R0K469_SPIOL|nr:uncharacterized protein LOC110797101 [Spinacia oleracea]